MGGFVLLAAWAAGWDRCFHRLPNALTAVLAVWALWMCAHAWWGGLVWSVPYAAAWRVRRGIGGGDVKLAVPMGIVAADCGLEAVLGAMAGASALTLIDLTLAHIRAVRSGNTGLQARRAPHGPGMVASTVAVLWLCG